MVVEKDYQFPGELLNRLDFSNKKIILLTAHRQENWGKGMKKIFRAVRKLIEAFPDTDLIYPVHLNPVVKTDAEEILGNLERVHLIPPLDYAPFANLMARAVNPYGDGKGSR